MKDVKEQAGRTRGDNIMLTMGSDFQFSKASDNFKNLDLLISTINYYGPNFTSILLSQYDGIHAFYSTPEMYTQYKYTELKKNSNDENATIEFETKSDDFFPYSDCKHCFWTGYFTSRPALKKMERVGSAFLHMARQVQALFTTASDMDAGVGSKEIDMLEKAMGIIQHHDGVSGTSKQHVAYDYAKKVQAGINEVESFVSNVIKEKYADLKLTNVAFCQLTNETICELSQVCKSLAISIPAISKRE